MKLKISCRCSLVSFLVGLRTYRLPLYKKSLDCLVASCTMQCNVYDVMSGSVFVTQDCILSCHYFGRLGFVHWVGNFLPVDPRGLSFLRTVNASPLNAELNPICHLLALLAAHHILHVSRIRVNKFR
jgi:hypothetical protein